MDHEIERAMLYDWTCLNPYHLVFHSIQELLEVHLSITELELEPHLDQARLVFEHASEELFELSLDWYGIDWDTVGFCMTW